ncbi:putative DNA binding domain-containing protein [Desulfosarcina sp. OttesenSCG-928-A07]|nr:putative DNA binding domain-containing protein [Desulfosarcina sp. OttesenSCG-928-A07]
MTPEQIRESLFLGEGQRIEFNASTRNLDALGKTVCGFLNASGGYLICGVNDKGDVIGVDTSPDTINQIEQLFSTEISPRTLISVQVEQVAEKSLIVIEVPAGKDVPYAFQDVIYIRVHETTKKADAETIRDIVLRRQIAPERWERRFSLANIDEDVDVTEVQRAVSDAGTVRRAFFKDTNRLPAILEDFSVSRYGRLTNGGDVLFAVNPAARLPQIRIRAVCYRSDKAGDTFQDMKSFEGPLHRIFESAYAFILRNTPTVSRFIEGNPKRQDAPLYPEAAIREALINALAHRDYSSPSGGIGIHVYPRRLEIWNAGALPDGVSTESLLKGQISILRNPDIAHVLYLRGFMEKAGRGSVLMVQQCRENGLPPPSWVSDSRLGVTVTFLAPEVTTDVTTEVATDVTTEVHRLLQHLEGEMTRQALQHAMGLKNAEHFRKTYLLPALEQGLIEMTIPDKPKSSKQQYRKTAAGKSFWKTK